MYTVFWLENLKGRGPLEVLDLWEDNIRMDVREIVWEGEDWIHLVQDTDSGGLL
jgi:hypothetical protein